MTVSPGASRATAPCCFLTRLKLSLVSLPLHYPVPNALASAGGAEETTQGEMKAFPDCFASRGVCLHHVLDQDHARPSVRAPLYHPSLLPPYTSDLAFPFPELTIVSLIP